MAFESLSALSSEYFLRIGAAEFSTGDWRELCVDGITLKPRDDSLGSIDSLSKCDPFLMTGPYEALDLEKQPRWILAREVVQEVPCPRSLVKRDKKGLENAEGTALMHLYTPPHDLFVQRPFPLILSE